MNGQKKESNIAEFMNSAIVDREVINPIQSRSNCRIQEKLLKVKKRRKNQAVFCVLYTHSYEQVPFSFFFVSNTLSMLRKNMKGKKPHSH